MVAEYYIEKKNNSRIRSDRYRDCKQLLDKETGDVLLATKDIEEIPTRGNDIYHRVKSNEVNRLDLLAHSYYRNPLLWWIIAQANNIYNPLADIEPGTVLRIPDIETLYGNKGILL